MCGARASRAPRILGSASVEWRVCRACQKSLAVPMLGGRCQKILAVPALSGVRAPHARNPWQCQYWVARASRAPRILGSARAGWRGGRACQKSLAVPELGGRSQITLAVPTLSGVRAPHARNPWQCQNWVARAADARRGRPEDADAPQRCIYANRSPTDSLRYAAISGSLMASATFAVIHAGTVPVSNPSLGSITRA